jgi:hypothetical protein
VAPILSCAAVQVRVSGTARDKIAANVLLVEENALANIAALDALLQLVGKSSGAKDTVGHALDALKELFKGVLLPDRPLVSFDKRPFMAVKPSKEGDKRLLLWWAEDCIKTRCALVCCFVVCDGIQRWDYACVISLMTGGRASMKETHSHTIPKSLQPLWRC